MLHASIPDADVITPTTCIARFYAGQAAYQEAASWYEQCVEIATTRLGADHPDTATSLNNLAELYRSQGRYSEAEPLYVRSLSILEKVLPPDHPNLAIGRENLERLREQMGRSTSGGDPLLLMSLRNQRGRWKGVRGVANQP